MDEVREFHRELARVRRILVLGRLRMALSWWAVLVALLLGAALAVIDGGVAADRARGGLILGVLSGIAWVTTDVAMAFLRWRDPIRLGRLLRRGLPGIRHAVEVLSRVTPGLDRFVPGASPALLVAEARRATTLLREARAEWFPPSRSRIWQGRIWALLGLVTVFATFADPWRVSRSLGALLGLPGGPSGAWWTGPPRIVDGIAYDLRFRVGPSERSAEELVTWIGDPLDVSVPPGGVVEVTGRLFRAEGALELVIQPLDGPRRHIPVPVEEDGRFGVLLQPEGDATWYLTTWVPPGEVTQESTRRRFRVATPAPPSLEIRPSGWLAGALGETIMVSWWASASLALGEVTARFRYPWTEEGETRSVSLRSAREGGRRAQAVFPVILGPDLLDRGGRMSLWVEAAGIASTEPGGRSPMLHLYLDVPLVRQLVLLDRAEESIVRLADLLGHAVDLPGPGDPALPEVWHVRLQEWIREVRSDLARLGVRSEAISLRSAFERAAGMVEELLQEAGCPRQRAVRVLESAITTLDEGVARERIGLLADQVADLERLADQLASARADPSDRDWSLRLRIGRWQVGALEAIRLSFLQKTPPESTGRRMALRTLGNLHRQTRDRLSRMSSGDPDEIRRALDSIREVAGRWRRLFAEGILDPARDILLPPSVREDLRAALTIQERVAAQTGTLATRIRGRMEQREPVPRERIEEWRKRLETAGDLLRQAQQPWINPYDLEDLKALERQVRFLVDLVEAGDIERASVSSRQVLGLLGNLLASMAEDLSSGPAEPESPEAGRGRRAFGGIGKAIEEVRAVQRSLREVVSSRRELLTTEEREDVVRQARSQREALRVFGRVVESLRRVSGVEGSEVVGLAGSIRGSMREAVDRLVRRDVIAAEAHQRKVLEDLNRFRSLLSRRDLDSFRGQESTRYWDDLRLPEQVPGKPGVQPWTIEVRKRLERILSDPDADLARAYYESLLAP